MRRSPIVFVVVISLSLSVGLGCVVESDSYERPDEAKDIVSDEQLERLEVEAGVPVYGGDSPPDIAGTYLFGDIEIIYNDSENWPNSGDNWCHSERTYERTDSDVRYERTSVSPNCNSTGEAVSNYISGEGDCFTLYNESKGQFEGCYSESIGIISACLNANGDMENPIGGGIKTHSEDSSECDEVIGDGRTTDEGEMNATKQEDELAPRID